MTMRTTTQKVWQDSVFAGMEVTVAGDDPDAARWSPARIRVWASEWNSEPGNLEKGLLLELRASRDDLLAHGTDENTVDEIIERMRVEFNRLLDVNL